MKPTYAEAASATFPLNVSRPSKNKKEAPSKMKQGKRKSLCCLLCASFMSSNIFCENILHKKYELVIIVLSEESGVLIC